MMMNRALPQNISQAKHKRIAFIGMSGVGKTTLSNLLPKNNWFHYSIDYRIGTRYLDEDIADFLKVEAMKQPLLARLLRSDSISIRSNITTDNLAPLSQYLGMVGDLEKGGLSLEAFSERLQKHRAAEINAINDTTHFIERALNIYEYPNFICDTSGSICEINSPETLEKLNQNCLIVYLRSTDAMQTELIARAQSYPKPLYYQQSFLLTAISDYCNEHAIESWQGVDPALFARWVFPRLVGHRLALYQSIADQYGITICASKTKNIDSESALLALIDETLSAYHQSYKGS